MSTPGKKSSEFSLTKNATAAGALGLLMTLVTSLTGEGGLLTEGLSWPVAALLMTVIASLAIVIASYNHSRGQAKIEQRVEPKEPG